MPHEAYKVSQVLCLVSHDSLLVSHEAHKVFDDSPLVSHAHFKLVVEIHPVSREAFIDKT